MSMNIDDLSLKELKDLQAKVSKAISSFEDRKKKNALAELEEKARAMGFSLAELTGAVTKIRRRAPTIWVSAAICWAACPWTCCAST